MINYKYLLSLTIVINVIVNYIVIAKDLVKINLSTLNASFISSSGVFT